MSDHYVRVVSGYGGDTLVTSEGIESAVRSWKLRDRMIAKEICENGSWKVTVNQPCEIVVHYLTTRPTFEMPDSKFAEMAREHAAFIGGEEFIPVEITVDGPTFKHVDFEGITQEVRLNHSMALHYLDGYAELWLEIEREVLIADDTDRGVIRKGAQERENEAHEEAVTAVRVRADKDERFGSW